MSDQHRGGAWGTSAENAVWWPSAISADQNNLHHQQILNQHHQNQQNHMQQQQQQIHQVVVQQQNDAARNNVSTSNAASQQLFSYKMASSFPSSAVSTSNAPSAYDYRLGMGATQGMNVTTSPGTQWWYTAAGQNALENLQQQQHQQQQQQISQQQQQQSQQQQQQISQQQSQSQQHQTQNIHNNVHSNSTPVSSYTFPIFLSLTHPCTYYFLAFYIIYFLLLFCDRPSE